LRVVEGRRKRRIRKKEKLKKKKKKKKKKKNSFVWPVLVVSHPEKWCSGRRKRKKGRRTTRERERMKSEGK